MKTYIITITDLITNTTHNLTRDESNIDKTIEKELGGWNNLRGAMTSNSLIDNINYQQTGTTYQNNKMFSILCYSKV